MIKKKIKKIKLPYFLPVVVIITILLLIIFLSVIKRNSVMTVMPNKKICDLDSDAQCDAKDQRIFDRSLGSHREDDINYDPLADADADGVVTEIDRQILFPSTPSITPFDYSLSIFLKSNVTNDEVNSLTNEIKNIGQVHEVKYISQNEAYQKYRKQIANDPELLKIAREDMFPPSITVYLNPSTVIQNQIENIAKEKSYVDSVLKTPRVIATPS